MTIVRRAVLVFLLLPIAAFAQSADQEVVSVTDAPDPVAPGATLTYTITLRNNGPDPAVNGGINVNLPLAVTHQNTVTPAGFTCFFLGNNGSCTTPSFAAGSTVVFTMNVLVSDSLAFFPDQSISANFFPSGTTTDPNSANNMKTASTTVDSPQIDLSLTVTDSPDPVFPDGNITYTVPVTNSGPDTATSVNFNVFNNGTLRFQSATVPAGWNCTLPAVNATATFTCTRASFPASTTDNFIVVVQAQQAVLGLNDGTVSTAFGVNGTGNDTNQANNNETEDTAYVTPDVDMAVAVSDSPDPVTPDNNITYTVTVQNNGPDTAPNATLNSFNNGSLQFQSATVPAGWNCTLPAVNAAPTFTCTNPSFPNGASSVFTFVVRASSVILGINDGTVSTNFTAGSAVADPNNANNSETEDTAYVTPDADISVTNSDAPDPVAPGGTITYTQSIANGGPDAAPNATFSQLVPAGTTFQSLASPAGWTCSTPAVGGTGAISCSKTSMAVSETGAFTLVVNVTGTGTITSTVQGGSSVADPDPLDNSATATTTSIGATSADLSITKTTATTNAPAGSTFSYTIVLTNNGPDAAASVVMTDILPASLLFRSIATPAGFICTTPAVGANGTITCNAATLANGASATFTLVVQVAASSGTFSNTATASSATADPNGGNSTGASGGVTAGPAQADIELTKTTGSTSATPGGTVNYTITVTNAGPSPATSVVVLDTLPAGLQFVSAIPSQGTCNNASPITCNLGTIANGGNATIAIATQVTATSGTITNSATVTSAEGDSDTFSASPIPVAAVQQVAPIPTVSEWGLLVLAALLALAAAVKMRM
jgi:uncharacterized repeat protein (TIGR01451 family)